MIPLFNQQSFKNTDVMHGIKYHSGSGIVTPLSSAPSGSWPLLGRSTLHLETRPAIDSKFASGPIVAASRGIAVDANRHDLWAY